MNSMSPFIAMMIKKAYDKGTTDEEKVKLGQAKYKAYFINTRIYEKYRSDVDTILETDDYGTCIVAD